VKRTTRRKEVAKRNWKCGIGTGSATTYWSHTVLHICNRITSCHTARCNRAQKPAVTTKRTIRIGYKHTVLYSDNVTFINVLCWSLVSLHCRLGIGLCMMLCIGLLYFVTCSLCLWTLRLSKFFIKESYYYYYYYYRLLLQALGLAQCRNLNDSLQTETTNARRPIGAYFNIGLTYIR